MTEYLIVVMILFALAAGVNAASAWAEKKHQYHTKRHGTQGFTVHLTYVGIMWAIFLGALIILPLSEWRLPGWVAPIGLAVLAAALLIFVSAVRAIGWHTMGNGNLFDRATDQSPQHFPSSAHRHLADPVYTSYALVFIATGLLVQNATYFILAAESFILLNLIEARLERPEPAR